VVEEPGSASVVRRAPYADSPFVGERGQRARQRIMEAALEAFGERGYQQTGVKRITELSGLSRAAFYQYFSSKEDVFRQLSDHVARQVAAAIDELRPITRDASGHASLRAWLERYTQIHDAYAPIFLTFHTAGATDEAVASGAAQVAVQSFTGLRSRVDGSTLPARQRDNVLKAIPASAARVNAVAALVRSAATTGHVASGGRVQQAMADVFHRVLFGPDPDVNVHAPPADDRPAVHRPEDLPSELDQEHAGEPPLSRTALRMRSRLLEAGHRVFAERGYYATRVIDVAKAANASHGIFYRYFDNKTELFRLLAEQASERLSVALGEAPTLTGPGVSDDVGTELRTWLTRYAATTADEATIIAMWSEAMSRDPKLSAVSAAVTERYRATCAEILRARGFGDVEADALVMLVLLDAMTVPRPTASRVETTARIIERGLLAGPGRPA
jgi:AcrR family transcriptional regulator